jgi:hypothetical protein
LESTVAAGDSAEAAFATGFARLAVAFAELWLALAL